MTYREKLEKDYPEVKEKGFDSRKYRCPEDYGYRKRDHDTPCLSGCDCWACWDQEMPYAEIKKDGIPVIPQSEVDAYNKGHSDGIAQGLNDAWDLAKKLWYLGNQKCKEIFGYEFSIDIIEHFTPQEALAKLKAYEETQSKVVVGDVVYHDPYGNGIMTREDEEYYNVLLENGDAICFEKESVTKTGKHIDISSILEQIGE